MLKSFLTSFEESRRQVPLTTEKMDSFFETHSLSQLFPYEAYDASTGLFQNQTSVGFVLETAPLVGSSEEMQEQIQQIFSQHLKEGSSLQVALWADPHIDPVLDRWAKARGGRHDMLGLMTQERRDFFKKKVWENHPPRNFRCLVSYTEEGRLDNPVLKERLFQFSHRLRSILSGVGLSPVVWTDQDLVQTLRNWVHWTQKEDPPVRLNPHEVLSSQIPAPSTLVQIEPDQMVVNDEFFVRTYHPLAEPDEWSLHAMGLLMGGDEERSIPCPFILHYGVHVPKQDSLKAGLMSKASYVENQAKTGLGKFIGTVEREAAELSYVRQQISQGARVVKSNFTVCLFAQKEKLEEAEQALMDVFIKQQWHLSSNRYTHLPTFLSCFPMMWGEGIARDLSSFRRLKTTLSTESSNLLPLQAEWCGTPTPGVLLTGRQGQVLTWSPFDNQSGNYNCCVVGRSGSGKSVFMQEILTSSLSLGGRVFVIDVGRSFEKTCHLLEGQFLEFSPNADISLNPFTCLPEGDSVQESEIRADTFAMLRPVLAMMVAPTKGTDDMDNALLEQALQESWALKGREMTLTTVSEYLLQRQNDRSQNLGTMLFPYTKKGAYGRYFEKPATVNFTNPLFVLELEELKEKKDLQGVVVQMMILQITNQMFLGDRTTPFHIVFDEAWDLLRGPQTGVFIETLARRLRKYNGSLVVGTQTVNDFFASPGAQACFDNSDWMCFLAQKKESIAQLKATNRLMADPQKEDLLLSIKTVHGHYSEVLIDGPHGYAACRFLLDPFSYALYSTKAEEYTAVKTLQNQGYSLMEALNHIKRAA